MKKVYKNTYYDFSVNEECDCIVFEWKHETHRMSENDFKEGLTNFYKYGQDHKCQEMVLDLRHFLGHPGPEVASDWRTHEVVPHYNKMGIKKFAYLIDPQQPAPQAYEPHKNDGESFETAVFNSEDEMWEWLKAK